MLGLADKSKIISLFKEVLEGNEKEALKFLKELINNGLDAKNFLNDVLEILYFFSRNINLGAIEKDMSISDPEAQMINQFSKNISMEDIGLFWQLTIKTIGDLRLVGNENLTLEMYIMQLVHLKNLDEGKTTRFDINSSDGQEENFKERKMIENNIETNLKNKTKNQLKSTNQIKTNPITNVENKMQKLK